MKLADRLRGKRWADNWAEDEREAAAELDRLTARVAELEKRNGELVAALRPFANFACSPPGECACNNCRARSLVDPDKGEK